MRTAERTTLLTVLVAVSLPVFVVATLSLWGMTRTFPLVPLFAFLSDVSTNFDTVFVGGLFVGCGGLLVGSSLGRSRREFGARAVRLSAALSACSLCALICLDQNRLQPWAYEFVILLALVVVSRGSERLRFVRWVVISIYLFSGIAKFDQPFAASHGPTLLATITSFVGLDSNTFPEWLRTGLILTMPLGEIAVGVLLAFRKTRRFGLWLATGLHTTLFVVLGPAGLDQRPGVLLWNVFFVIQNWLAFTDEIPSSDEETIRRPHAARLVVLIVILLPFLEPWGLWDPWPSWAVYSAHHASADVYIAEDARAQVPVDARRFLRPAGEQGGRRWLLLDVSSWALDSLRAPVPPGVRVPLGVADRLSHSIAARDILIGFRSSADRWSGAVTRSFITWVRLRTRPPVSILGTASRRTTESGNNPLRAR